MEAVVGPSQFAFILGRQIIDCLFIANEGIDYWRRKGLEGIAFKVDFKRTYDSIDWDLLLKIMDCMGFGQRWRSWMKMCLFTTSISVLVDGSLLDEFRIVRGLP
ncbi:uncharacterized protein LOC120163209 [Hibiscus syriacus]|uniref:uncharacterized protein LOC120163209 n=1 Tax=Hibiscus syriacus TaxID=106335 RepID=UPI0019218489|nr:uncharacterized protein LOC120163209 [Hibiscus syriacus]